MSLPVREVRSGDGCRTWRGDGHRLRNGDVDVPQRFCWRGPDRGGDSRFFRVVPGDVARISDPPRLRIQELIAIPSVIIPNI